VDFKECANCMHIDHIFVFADAPHAVADELRAFGLTEGSCRVHSGQGTANRKFYFGNFFLEIIWVQNETEIRSPAVLPTGLWQRARPAETGASPYGLCLANTPDTDRLFAAALAYQPTYFPAGLVIDVLPHAHNPSLPWTFRLPFKGTQATPTEPTDHRSGLSQLTAATFGLPHYDPADPLLQHTAHQPQLRFTAASAATLHLIFDHGRQGKTRDFTAVPLRISY
jgi:hypothetical protein